MVSSRAPHSSRGRGPARELDRDAPAPARGVNQSHALVVGTGRLRAPDRAHAPHGELVGDSASGTSRTIATVAPRPNLPVLGSIADLQALVEQNHIEHVFVALPLNRYADARGCSRPLADVVDVALIADLPADAGMTFTTTQIHG